MPRSVSSIFEWAMMAAAFGFLLFILYVTKRQLRPVADGAYPPIARSAQGRRVARRQGLGGLPRGLAGSQRRLKSPGAVQRILLLGRACAPRTVAIRHNLLTILRLVSGRDYAFFRHSAMGMREIVRLSPTTQARGCARADDERKVRPESHASSRPPPRGRAGALRRDRAGERDLQEVPRRDPEGVCAWRGWCSPAKAAAAATGWPAGGAIAVGTCCACSTGRSRRSSARRDRPTSPAAIASTKRSCRCG